MERRFQRALITNARPAAESLKLPLMGGQYFL
jgi:hypothetical protein